MYSLSIVSIYMDLDYRQMFDGAKNELERLRVEKSSTEDHLNMLNAQIDAMTKTYNALAPLVGEEPIQGIMETIINASLESITAHGISVTIRSVLDAAPHENFTSADMRDRLAAQGWKWERYVNPLGTVHTVLTRLVQSGAAIEGGARPGTNGEGAKTFYSAKRNPLASTIAASMLKAQQMQKEKK